MSFKTGERRIWDTTATLEALSGADVALWIWEPEADRLRLLGEAQRILAEDSANVFRYQPQLITIAARGLRGLWKDAPIFANDIAAMSWA